MKRARILTLVVLAGIPFSVAKDRRTITIQVVDTKTWDRAVTLTLPGTPAQSDTNCSGNDTGNGVTVNCTTTTTPGTPATTSTRYLHQIQVHAIMPDGSKVILWCQQQWRECAELNPGAYEAEVDKAVLWVRVSFYKGRPQYNRDGTAMPREIRIERVKYHISGTE